MPYQTIMLILKPALTYKHAIVTYSFNLKGKELYFFLKMESRVHVEFQRLVWGADLAHQSWRDDSSFFYSEHQWAIHTINALLESELIKIFALRWTKYDKESLSSELNFISLKLK